jgi:soluble lytic murein transglycosylase-like protein
MENIILFAAQMVKVPPALLLAICVHESGLKNVIAPYDGNSPTYGVCQVKLESAQDLGFSGDEKDLMKPSVNAHWAAMILKKQIVRYNGDLCKATAAYNAGSYNESKVMPGYPKNLKYVRSVQRKLASVLRVRLSCSRRS